MIIALSFFSVILCGLLLKRTLDAGFLPGCGPQSTCDAIQKSRWARIGPVPVVALGAVVYSVLLVTSLLQFMAEPSPLVHSARVMAAVMAGGTALWFTFVQLAVIRRLCAYCLLINALGTTACILVLFRLAPSITPFLAPIGAALACLAVFILAQLFIPPKTFRSVPASQINPMSVHNPEPEFQRPAPQEQPAQSSAAVSLVDGRAKLSVDQWPLMGSRNAARVIAVLFDVTCKDCRSLHRLLEQVVRHHPAELAILIVPVPMHHACNQIVPKNDEHESFACEFARLFLAAWRVDPVNFSKFSQWLMSPTQPPPFCDARTKAYRLLDSMRLNLALMDSTIDKDIGSAVNIYNSVGTGALPRLLLENQVIMGRVDTLKDALKILGVADSKSLKTAL